MSTASLETMPVPVRALVTGTIKEDVNWVLAKQASFDQSIYSIAEFGKALLSLHFLMKTHVALLTRDEGTAYLDYMHTLLPDSVTMAFSYAHIKSHAMAHKAMRKWKKRILPKFKAEQHDHTLIMGESILHAIDTLRNKSFMKLSLAPRQLHTIEECASDHVMHLTHHH
tara:strand:- start:1368 stop:1874 length:507 start_codon:yes stop_codon:yes gene_type:complete